MAEAKHVGAQRFARERSNVYLPANVWVSPSTQPQRIPSRNTKHDRSHPGGFAGDPLRVQADGTGSPVDRKRPSVHLFSSDERIDGKCRRVEDSVDREKIVR